jgi:Fungal hydrophobin
MYKRGAHYSSIPQSKAQLQDHHSLHPVFTMMLYKPFVSLLTALAVVGSVAASATPVARGGYPPPSPPPVSQCNTGSVQCCDILTNSDNPVLDLLVGLLPLGTIIDPTLIVGLTCSVLEVGDPW